MTIPVCTWIVRLECRKEGAQGIYTWELFRVRAKDDEFAINYAIEDAHMRGYDTRFGSVLRIA